MSWDAGSGASEGNLPELSDYRPNEGSQPLPVFTQTMDSQWIGQKRAPWEDGTAALTRGEEVAFPQLDLARTFLPHL